MLVTMAQTVTASINGGITYQEFRGGQQYDVPDEIGEKWVADGICACLGDVAEDEPHEAPHKGRKKKVL